MHWSSLVGATLPISVIIPAHNAAETIRACIEALQHQTASPSEYEIIVVDDGSKDRTREIVEEYNVCLLEQSNGGPAAARNLGVRHARGQLVLFTDADCEPATDWIEQMTVPFACSGVVGAKGVYRTRQREVIARFVQLEYEEKYEKMREEENIDFVDTYSAAYRKDVFSKYGSFDASFPRASGEDIEFSYRLSRMGCKLVFAPQAGVYHRHPDSLTAYVRRKYHVGYWRVLMYLRHPQKLIGDSHTPQMLKVQMVLAPVVAMASVAALFRKRFRPAAIRLVILFIFSTLSFCRQAICKDRLVTLVSPMLLLIRGIALALGFAIGLAGLVTGRVDQ